MKKIEGYLLHWPFLTLLLLISLFSLYLETNSVFFLCSFVLLLCLAFFVHLKNKHYFKFIFISTCLAFSFISFSYYQNPLSQNLNTTKSLYTASTINSVIDDSKTRITAKLTHRLLDNPEPVAGNISITLNGQCHVPNNSVVLFSSSIKPITSFLNPGSFDYQKYMARKNIWGKAYLSSCNKLIILDKPSKSLKQSLRHQILFPKNLNKLKNTNILGPLTIASKSLEKDTKELLQQTGLSHLFVISGTHFGVMCFIIYFLTLLIGNRIPNLYLKIPKQKLASITTALFVIGYLWLAFKTPSVLRAGIMALLYFGSVIFNQQKYIIYILICAACFYLIFYPFDIFEISFQLSYLCVIVLIVIYPKFLSLIRYKNFSSFIPKALRPLAHIFFISLLLNICLLPITTFYFGKSPLQSFINNLWAIPYFHFITVPLSLTYLIASIIAPNLAHYVLPLWDSTLTLFFSILNYINSWQIPSINTFTPHIISVLLFYLFLFVFFLFKNKTIWIISFFALIISLFITWHVRTNNFDFKITQIDVGQGDAILVQTDNKNILIDTGGLRYFDINKNVLTPFLKHEWVNSLDAVIITHSDFDHYGALFSLMDTVKIKELWMSHITSQSLAIQNMIDTALLNNVKIKILGPHENISLDNNTKISILAPNKNYLKQQKNQNEYSLVFAIQHSNFKALFTGDLTKRGEKRLIKEYGNLLKSDYLKIAHHGSKTSTTDDFIKYVNPKYASIGVGKEHKYGMPHKTILNRLIQNKAQILRTDIHGASGIVIKKGRIYTHQHSNASGKLSNISRFTSSVKRSISSWLQVFLSKKLAPTS